jgi:sulfatase modifying factor 1
VLDFNNVMISDDSRGTGGSDRQLYCAAAASTARDPSDYAAFLRYSFRASLTGRSTQSNLGFRCVRSVR